MLTKIVVLYIIIQYNLPVWCKILVILSLVFTFWKTLFTFCYSLVKTGNTNYTSEKL